MNCKLTHEKEYVKFEFDEWKSIDGSMYKTIIIFIKESKSFSVRNDLDYYGQGNTLRIKEFQYATNYLERKNLL